MVLNRVDDIGIRIYGYNDIGRFGLGKRGLDENRKWGVSPEILRALGQWRFETTEFGCAKHKCAVNNEF